MQRRGASGEPVARGRTADRCSGARRGPGKRRGSSARHGLVPQANGAVCGTAPSRCLPAPHRYPARSPVISPGSRPDGSCGCCAWHGPEHSPLPPECWGGPQQARGSPGMGPQGWQHLAFGDRGACKALITPPFLSCF